MSNLDIDNGCHSLTVLLLSALFLKRERRHAYARTSNNAAPNFRRQIPLSPEPQRMSFRKF